jgi:hypothetical protein
VIHDVDAADGSLDRLSVSNVSLNDLDAGGLQHGGAARVADERADRLRRGKGAGQVATGEAGGAGD